MNQFIVYIIYSEKLGKFYTGYSSHSIEQRMEFHLSEHKGFTSKAKDWKCIFQKTLLEKSDVLALEKKINKRGAKRFLQDLKLI